MGNKQTLDPQIPQINELQWQQIIVGKQEHPQYGDFRTLVNLNNNRMVDEYEITFTDEQDFKIYIDYFQWRLREPHIVSTMFLKQQHIQQLCSKTYVAKVYIQHIQTRLSDITDIPYPENIYVGICALEGFHKLYEIQQYYFEIQENLICVDSQGHVRVWMNSDLSKNYPQVDQQKNYQGSESDMVRQIIAILTQNTDSQSQPACLRDYFQQNAPNNMGFQQAKVILSQYARLHNVDIPTCFESILEIYNREREEDSDNEPINPKSQSNEAESSFRAHPLHKNANQIKQPLHYFQKKDSRVEPTFLKVNNGGWQKYPEPNQFRKMVPRNQFTLQTSRNPYYEHSSLGLRTSSRYPQINQYPVNQNIIISTQNKAPLPLQASLPYPTNKIGYNSMPYQSPNTAYRHPEWHHNSNGFNYSPSFGGSPISKNLYPIGNSRMIGNHNHFNSSYVQVSGMKPISPPPHYAVNFNSPLPPQQQFHIPKPSIQQKICYSYQDTPIQRVQGLQSNKNEENGGKKVITDKKNNTTIQISKFEQEKVNIEERNKIFKEDKIEEIESDDNNQLAITLLQNHKMMRSDKDNNDQQLSFQKSNIGRKPSTQILNQQKAYYFTVDTEQQLDPQIAADLKKFYFIG